MEAHRPKTCAKGSDPSRVREARGWRRTRANCVKEWRSPTGNRNISAAHPELVRERQDGRFINYEVDPRGSSGLGSGWLISRVLATSIDDLKTLLKDMDQ
jgi:hypothetical protein